MAAHADIVQMAPSLYRVRIPSERAHLLNCYVFLGEDAVTLIDCGWPDSAALIADALRQLDRRPGDIERLVLTHFHEDHAGSAEEIASWCDATVVAGRADADYIRGHRPGPSPQLTAAERTIHPPEQESDPAPPSRVDIEVEDGDELDFAGGAVVLGVAGHTPGSIALHLPGLGVVLTGDVAAEFHGDVITGAFHIDRDQVHQSVGRLADTGAQVAGFGHGEIVTVDAAARLATATDPLG